MRVFVKALAVLAAGVAATTAALADPISARGQERSSAYMRVFGPTDPPYAFWRFCDEFPADCAKGRVVEARFEATPARLAELDRINRHINKTIQPVTDMDLYGISDYWTLPAHGQGDCEDYALLKRHELMAAGWPSSALLITVVRDEKQEGHAVLTARTAQGDFLLDNKIDDIKLWNRSGYRFVMRQSYLDPKAWVALDPAQLAPPVAIAGVDAD
jgi:predicted transglutaminase-like cysteine proteinase